MTLDFRVQSMVQVQRILYNLLLTLHFRDIEFSRLKSRVSYIKHVRHIYPLYTISLHKQYLNPKYQDIEAL